MTFNVYHSLSFFSLNDLVVTGNNTAPNDNVFLMVRILVTKNSPKNSDWQAHIKISQVTMMCRWWVKHYPAHNC